MAKTMTEQLRAGILASGWQATDTRSGRECFTKVCRVVKPCAIGADGKPVIEEARMWLWLGEAGSVRWAPRNAFTAAYPVGPRMKARLMAAT